MYHQKLDIKENLDKIKKPNNINVSIQLSAYYWLPYYKINSRHPCAARKRLRPLLRLISFMWTPPFLPIRPKDVRGVK